MKKEKMNVVEEIKEMKSWDSDKPTILLTSKSKCKIQAVKNVYPYCNIITTECLVDNQPMGLEGTIKAADNRQKHDKNAYMCITIENGVAFDKNYFGKCFDFPYISILGLDSNKIDISNNGKNCTGAVMVPDCVAKVMINEKITWGLALKNMIEKEKPNIICNSKDPHLTITGIPRHVYIEKALRKLIVDAIKPEITIDHPRKNVKFISYANVFSDQHLNFVLFEYICKDLLVDMDFDLVAGIDARGFDIGAVIAQKMGKGFVRIRKKGKMPPGNLVRKSYTKEYGKDHMEMKTFNNLSRKPKVLVVDDILASGGTMFAACDLVEEAGGEYVGGFVLAIIRDLYEYDIETIKTIKYI